MIIVVHQEAHLQMAFHQDGGHILLLIQLILVVLKFIAEAIIVLNVYQMH